MDTQHELCVVYPQLYILAWQLVNPTHAYIQPPNILQGIQCTNKVLLLQNVYVLLITVYYYKCNVSLLGVRLTLPNTSTSLSLKFILCAPLACYHQQPYQDHKPRHHDKLRQVDHI